MVITLSGAGGVGKTTLMNDLYKNFKYEKFGIPTSELMPENIKSHSDVLKMAVNDPERGIGFQNKLIGTRLSIIESKKEKLGFYITDRSPIDSIAYYMIHNSAFDSSDNSMHIYKNTILDSLRLIDHIIFITPKNMKEVESNGMRCENLLFFEVINSVFSYIYYDMTKECDSVIKYEYKNISIESRHLDKYSCIVHRIVEDSSMVDRLSRANIIDRLIKGEMNEII